MKPEKPKLSPLAAQVIADIRHSADPKDCISLSLVARLLALALTSPAEAARVLNEVADNLR